MVVVQPSQARGIGEEQRRIASERRYRIRVPVRLNVNDHGVGDTRAIRRKCQVVFLARIVSQLNRLAVGKQFYENLIGGEEWSVASVEFKNSSVRRQSGRDSGVREAGDLGVGGQIGRASC